MFMLPRREGEMKRDAGSLHFTRRVIAVLIKGTVMNRYGDTTGLPAYSDTVGTREKCHCKQVSL